jgi:DNA-binding protein YbaB
MRSRTWAEVETMLGEYRSLRRRLERLNEHVATLTATARSADGCVVATVGPRGELAGLTIDAAMADRLGATEISRRVLEAAGAAAERQRGQLRAAMAEFLPPALGGLVRPDGTVDVARVLPVDPTAPVEA